MILTCTTTVLEQVVVTSSDALFRSPEDAPSVNDLTLARSTWDDMDSPTELTVTVRPGNTMGNILASRLIA